jgi:hypothetical protein
MLTLTLDVMRRMFGSRGTDRFAETRPAPRVPGADLIYRLKAWPQLPEAGRTAEIYRMLSVMSSRPVNRQWVLTRTRMERHQLEELLHQWVREGAIEVIDPARFAGSTARAGSAA